MRKLAVTVAAIAGIAGAWVATAGPNDSQPRGQAYLLIPFGASKHAAKEPLHYGLRLDYDARVRTSNGNALPALANIDFDSSGNRLALVGGVPFAGRIVAPLRQNEGGDAPAAGGSSGGFTFFDWGLLAVGIGGVGYVIYKAAENKNTPDPPGTPTGTTTGGTTGGTSGGLLGGLTGGTSGGLLGGLTGGTTGGTSGGTTGGLLGGTTGGLLGGVTGYAGSEAAGDFERHFDHDRWLDSGTGQMGDIGPQPIPKSAATADAGKPTPQAQ